MMPPSPQGTVQEQLVRQYSYLFQMAQQLNVALDSWRAAGLPHPPAALRPRRQSGSSSIRP